MSAIASAPRFAIRTAFPRDPAWQQWTGTAGKRGNSHRWLAGLLPFVVVVALVGGVAGNGALREVVSQAWARISWQAVLVTLPAQLLANVLYAGGLYAMRPGVSWRACFTSRLLRDAGCNLLVVVSGLGEAIGARIMVVLGARSRAAITATALDALAEAAAQIPSCCWQLRFCRVFGG